MKVKKTTIKSQIRQCPLEHYGHDMGLALGRNQFIKFTPQGTWRQCKIVESLGNCQKQLGCSLQTIGRGVQLTIIEKFIKCIYDRHGGATFQ